MEFCGEDLICSLGRFVGQTVTIFTTSGGLSGDGFTGVLLCVDNCVVKLLTNMACAPDCPVGSACTGWCPGDRDGGRGYGGYGYGGYGGNGGYGGCGGCGDCWLGSEVVIPLHSVACFVHHAL